VCLRVIRPIRAIRDPNVFFFGWLRILCYNGPQTEVAVAEPVSIIIPAHNEEQSIGKVLKGISSAMESAGIEHEIIVVNDGSSDGTSRAAAEHPRVRVIDLGLNLGYGAAIKHGLKKARHELVAITDADGTYPPEALPNLVRSMDDSDMVVGARTGANVAMPLMRRPAKWALTALANYLASTKIPDLNSGMRVMRKSALDRFLNILPQGFSFTTTITLAMLSNNYRVRFSPIDYHPRTGKSKIRPFSDTLGFLMIIVRTIMYFNPLKIFLPISSALLLAGIALLLYSAFALHKVMDVTVVILVSFAIQVAVIGLLADLIDKRTQ
jgi:glycosyltransferase involved in cell wall biosynthesis